ncbi:TetR/AcrR family transcriptional regulator [Sinomicrobium sp. M5D2P17]
MKNSKTREGIIRTAARLFYRQGYSRTGINQIIEEADIAKSTLYQHFKSKEELLLAYLEEAGETTVKALINAANKETQPLEKILSIFSYIEELISQPDFYGCHFLNLVYEMPDGDELTSAQVKKQKDAVRQLIAEAVNPVKRPELADEIYTLLEGALIAHKIHQSSWPIQSAMNVIRKIV